jgi:lysozyme
MQTSEKGRQFIRREEGLKLYAYKDAVGKLTIGVGHLLTVRELETDHIMIDGELVAWRSDGLNIIQADKLLAQDLESRDEFICEIVKVHLDQHQFDALSSLTFNIGVHAFMESTLLRYLNEGNYDEVPAQIKRWNKAKGKVLDDLAARREREAQLWSSGEYGF